MDSPPQTTPLSVLLGNREDKPMADPTANFAQLPNGNIIPTNPITNQQPMGMGQGLSMPEPPSRKEFFGLKEFDYKSAILVFAIILILSSGMFSSCVKPYVPGSVGTDGRTTIVGSLIAAFVGVLIFVIVKFVGKF